MKQLLLSLSILILSYYPVYALELSREKSKNILLTGEVLGSHFDPYFYIYLRDKDTVYKCKVDIDRVPSNNRFDHITKCWDWNGLLKDQ